MVDALAVVMGGAIAGRLTRIRDGRLRFEYDEAYQAGTESTPLSLSMPLQIRVHDDDHRAPVVTAFLSNLLPDNDAVLARWSRRFQVPTTPFALLGTPIGEDCAGAVRFCPEDDLERVLADPGSMAWLTEADVAARLRNLKQDTTAWLGADFTGQFSLAGAQAKTALSLRDGRWALPSGAMATTHILKPAVAGLDDHDLNEHLCLDAARRAGLLVARSHLAMFEDQSAVVVERYDRRLADGQVIRIHQEDLCQALGVMPERKYQNEGGPTAGMIAELLRRSMPSQAAEESVGRFADALIWNWLIAGTDAHAKNYSLLMSGVQVRLAPLYDIASALPYPIHEKKLRLAMKLGGEYSVHPWRNFWPAAARELGLDADCLVGRVRELAAEAPSAFSEAAAVPEIAALDRRLSSDLVERVADRSGRCARVVGEGGSA